MSFRLLFRRQYAVRAAEDTHIFDQIRAYRKPWVNWKTCAVFFGLGCYLQYSEAIYEAYEVATAVPLDPLLPVQLTHKMKQLPVYQKLTHPSNSDNWKKYTSWENLENFESVMEKFNLGLEEGKLTHSLHQAGGIVIKPVTFFNPGANEGVAFIHAGYRLCGYPFLVHGGMIATILNEQFKRNACLSQLTSSSLKDDFMVKRLVINYKAPTVANQFLVVKTSTKQSIDGKNIVLKSVMENEKGKRLVTSEAVLEDTGRATQRLNQAEALANRKKWFGIL